MLGVRIYHGDGVVEVLAKRLRVLLPLLAFVESIQEQGAAAVVSSSWCSACAVASGARQLEVARRVLQLVGAQSSMGVVLAGEIVGEDACREVGGHAERAGGIGGGARQARGRVAGGALAAVEDLGEEAAARLASCVTCAMGRSYWRTSCWKRRWRSAWAHSTRRLASCTSTTWRLNAGSELEADPRSGAPMSWTVDGRGRACTAAVSQG